MSPRAPSRAVAVFDEAARFAFAGLRGRLKGQKLAQRS